MGPLARVGGAALLGGAAGAAFALATTEPGERSIFERREDWEAEPKFSDPVNVAAGSVIMTAAGTGLGAAMGHKEMFGNGPKLHMIAFRENGNSYYVTNTLLNRMSNETMLAIAKGLKPLGQN